MDTEALVGRYGTMALAALTIIMGVGAFLTWAVANFSLNPAARVALGAVAALVLAGAGWRLRQRGARAFGGTLLALALAIVHVDAWGAGPYLGIVPHWVALGVAAAASVALAALAWRSGEQALFVVGVGGALLAPFVAAPEGGSPLVLLGYGWLVVTAGLATLRGRTWRIAERLLLVGVWAYVGAALASGSESGAWPERDAPTLFALACAWSAIAAAPGRRHPTLAPNLLLVALVALGAAVLDGPSTPRLVALAGAGTATLYVALHGRDHERRPWTLAALALPLAFLLLALMALSDATTPRGAAVALAWTGAALVAAWLTDRERWGAHLAAAAFAAALAVVLALWKRPEAMVATLAALGAGCAFVARRTGARLVLLPMLVVFAGAALGALDLLTRRFAYKYTPFLTLESAAAAAVVVALCVAAYLLVRRDDDRPPALAGAERTASVAIPAGAALLWGREELARAVSPDVSTFLLILYFAATGVGTIAFGRRRHASGVRRVGLALAIYAALKALAQASGLDSVGLRVGSYLLVGGFLLAVAYWYRATSEPGPDAPRPAGVGDPAPLDDAADPAPPPAQAGA